MSKSKSTCLRTEAEISIDAWQEYEGPTIGLAEFAQENFVVRHMRYGLVIQVETVSSRRVLLAELNFSASVSGDDPDEGTMDEEVARWRMITIR